MLVLFSLYLLFRLCPYSLMQLSVVIDCNFGKLFLYLNFYTYLNLFYLDLCRQIVSGENLAIAIHEDILLIIVKLIPIANSWIKTLKSVVTFSKKRLDFSRLYFSLVNSLISPLKSNFNVSFVDSTTLIVVIVSSVVVVAAAVVVTIVIVKKRKNQW